MLFAVVVLEEQITLVGAGRTVAGPRHGGVQPRGERAGGPLAQVSVRVVNAVTVEMRGLARKSQVPSGWRSSSQGWARTDG